MKQYTPKYLLGFAFLLPACAVMAQNSGTSPYGPFFQHTVSSANSVSNWSNMTHPNLDGNPSAVPLYTHNWNPNNAGGIYTNFPQGIYYSGSPGWAIYSQDYGTFDTLPYEATYNILVPSGGDAFNYSDSASTYFNYMLVDHPSLNGNQDAIFFAVQTYEPHNVYQTYPIGVWYDVYSQMWGIFDQDGSTPMDPGAGFNVFVPSVSSSVYTHVADVSNSFYNYTVLDHPSLNGDSSKVIIVTQNWNPTDTIGVYNDREVGVWYTGTHWSIYNEDDATPIPLGAAFNVLVMDQVSGVEAMGSSTLGFTAYPNPANDKITLSYQTSADYPVVAALTDMLGRVVLLSEFTGDPDGHLELDVTNLLPGVYNCTVSTNGQSSSLLVMVN
jgi:hypothetical protein